MHSRRRIHWVALALLACVIAAVVAVLFVARGARHADAKPVRIAVVSAAPSQTAQGVLVHVVGAVRKPGLYTVAATARIGDAIHAAGGFAKSADEASVNLAGKPIDGTQIVVRKRGAHGDGTAAPGGGTQGRGTSESGGGTGANGASVSLNQASAEELQTLDKIGPALSQRIIDYRTEHGGFSSVEQLLEVSGIGDKIFSGVKGRVTL